MLLDLLTNDCYGGMMFEYQGADLELSTQHLVIEGGIQLGGFVQDPSGWIQLYNRPNPQSTAGVYYGGQTFGFQGSILPYVPTTIVKLTLGDGSTESAAMVSGGAQMVAITDPRLFMRSLRSVLGMPVILPIDPALLVPGREELTVKGPQEKEGK